MTSRQGTALGLVAILFWSSIVGLLRLVSEDFGPVAGAALVYTLGAVLQIGLCGWPQIHLMPKRYLIIGSLLFVTYELCLSLSIGLAHNRMQAIEVGMVNYLWPGLTVAAAVLLGIQRFKVGLLVGLCVSFVGISWVLSGQGDWSLEQMVSRVGEAPTSYVMAFCGALIWAIYCNLTTLMARGHNGIVIFFSLTAMTLWGQYALSDAAALSFASFSWSSISTLLMAALAMGGGYAAWNLGILHGNMTLLSTLSYFVPVFSAVLAAWQLSTKLGYAFWAGAGLVVLGSLMCWWVTRAQPSQQEGTVILDEVSGDQSG